MAQDLSINSEREHPFLSRKESQEAWKRIGKVLAQKMMDDGGIVDPWTVSVRKDWTMEAWPKGVGAPADPDRAKLLTDQAGEDALRMAMAKHIQPAYVGFDELSVMVFDLAKTVMTEQQWIAFFMPRMRSRTG
jgi:hypothetical protein